MNVYQVWIQGHNLKSIQAENPQDAIKLAVGTNDVIITPAKDSHAHSQSNARVTLIKNGIAKTPNFYIVVPKQKEKDKEVRVFVVTFCRQPYSDDVAGGVELAGVFSTADKAQTAKSAVRQWLNKKGYDEGEVFVSPTTLDRLSFYEVDRQL